MSQIKLKETVSLNPECRFCHMTVPLEVDAKELHAWSSGKPIQDALPSLNKDEREMLITGTCPQCWDQMMLEPIKL